MIATPAPPLSASHWFNCEAPVTLDGLRGRVVVVEAFQMLCPGCVAHGLPQAARIAQTFAREPVTVIGLHSVFEHHDVQGTPAALGAFIHEYRWPFPIALDAASPNDRLPQTMRAWQLQGTPSLVIIDRHGIIRHNHFGRPEDMAIGAQIMALVNESGPASVIQPVSDAARCAIDGDGCT